MAKFKQLLSVNCVAMALSIGFIVVSVSVVLAVTLTSAQSAADDFATTFSRSTVASGAGKINDFISLPVNRWRGLMYLTSGGLLPDLTVDTNETTHFQKLTVYRDYFRAALFDTNFLLLFMALGFVDGSFVSCQALDLKADTSMCVLVDPLNSTYRPQNRSWYPNYYYTFNTETSAVVNQSTAYNPTLRPWYGRTPSRNTTGPYFGDIYIDFMLNIPIADLNNPVFDPSGRLIGKISFTLDLRYISIFLASLITTPNTLAVLVDNDGFLLGASSLAPLWAVSPVTNATAAAVANKTAVLPPGCDFLYDSKSAMLCRFDAVSFNTSKALNALAAQRPWMLVVNATNNNNSSASNHVQHEKIKALDGDSTYYVTAAPIALPSTAAGGLPALNMRWRLVGLIPEMDIIQAIITGRNLAIGLAVAVLVIASVTCAVLLYLLLRPLAAVAGQMEDAAAFKDHVLLAAGNRSRLAEVRTIQDAFYRLCTQLKKAKSFLPETLLAQMETEESYENEDSDEERIKDDHHQPQNGRHGGAHVDDEGDLWNHSEGGSNYHHHGGHTPGGGGGSSRYASGNTSADGQTPHEQERSPRDDHLNVTAGGGGGRPHNNMRCLSYNNNNRHDSSSQSGAESLSTAHSDHNNNNNRGAAGVVGVGGRRRADMRSNGTHRSAHRAQQLSEPLAIATRNVSVLSLNVRGFHNLLLGGGGGRIVNNNNGHHQTSSSSSAAAHHILTQHYGGLIDAVRDAAKEHRGVLDAFHGDRIFCTFNAVRPCGSHAAAAVMLALQLRDHCAVGITCGIATGIASVGNMGSETQRRFCTVGHVYSQAGVLERLAKFYNGVDVLVGPVTANDADPMAHILHVDIVPGAPAAYSAAAAAMPLESKHENTTTISIPTTIPSALAAAPTATATPNGFVPLRVSAAMGLKQARSDEWMYELVAAATLSPFTACNAAFDTAAAGQFAEAAALLKLVAGVAASGLPAASSVGVGAEAPADASASVESAAVAASEGDQATSSTRATSPAATNPLPPQARMVKCAALHTAAANIARWCDTYLYSSSNNNNSGNNPNNHPQPQRYVDTATTVCMADLGPFYRRCVLPSVVVVANVSDPRSNNNNSDDGGEGDGKDNRHNGPRRASHVVRYGMLWKNSNNNNNREKKVLPPPTHRGGGPAPKIPQF